MLTFCLHSHTFSEAQLLCSSANHTTVFLCCSFYHSISIYNECLLFKGDVKSKGYFTICFFISEIKLCLGEKMTFINSASEEYTCKNNSRVIKEFIIEQKQQQQSEDLVKGRFTHPLQKGFKTS